MNCANQGCAGQCFCDQRAVTEHRWRRVGFEFHAANRLKTIQCWVLEIEPCNKPLPVNRAVLMPEQSEGQFEVLKRAGHVNVLSPLLNVGRVIVFVIRFLSRGRDKPESLRANGLALCVCRQFLFDAVLELWEGAQIFQPPSPVLTTPTSGVSFLQLQEK